MLKVGELNENNVLTLEVSETLKKSDYEENLPVIKKLLSEHPSIRFYIQLNDFRGFNPEALWEDIKFSLEYKEKYGKTAIVGDRTWEKWGTQFSSLFFSAEMKYFDKSDAEKAWAWVNAAEPAA